MDRNDSQAPIRVSVPDARERRKRQRELWLAAGAFVCIVLLGWAELKFMGLESSHFFVLFNFNFLLLLVVLGVVLRNVVKLVLERRRRVLGSRLRTRMVLAFMTLSLAPTALLFFISVKFVQTSVDYWFKAQVERSMEQSIRVARDLTTAERQRLVAGAEHILAAVDPAMDDARLLAFFRSRAAEHSLAVAGLVDAAGAPRQLALQDGWQEPWEQLRGRLDWSALAREAGGWSSMEGAAGRDLVLAVRPAPGGFLVLGQAVNPDIKARLDQIVQGQEAFRKLRLLKQPIKVALYLTLGVMTLLIILAAIFFGFRMAKELSAPIQALAAGTQRIAQGDLSVRLMDHSDDELGFLVKSFNSMAQDLEQSQARLQLAKLRLERQNQELEEWGRYMEAVLDNITAGVVSLDRRGRIFTVNKAAEAMLGVDGKAILGKTPLQLLRGEYADLVREILAQLERGFGSQWQRQVGVKLAEREFRYLVNVVVLRAEDGRENGLVAVFEDIGEMEKTQRLAAWREVARRIAHEIKNPLTPIKLSAQRIERKFAATVDDPAFGEATGLIVRHVEHLQRMVQEFSAFARLPEVAPRPGLLPPLVDEVVSLFRSGHAGIDFRVEVAGELPPLSFDPEALRRVLMNILSNSVEAIASAGEGQQGQGGLVEVRLEPDPRRGLVRVEVADNGPGLTAEERQRLFEPYFSRRKGGTGLGLTIVRSVVADHQGTVRARANEPHGTVIVIELPATMPA